MPAKLDLPEEEIVHQWLHDIESTTASLGEEYGCSHVTIIDRLHKHLDADTIDEVKRTKLSHSASQRTDLRSGENLRRLEKARAKITPAIREAHVDVLQRAAMKSADKRRGVPLTEEHKANMKGPRPCLRGEKNPNWKGGVSKHQWRKPNWRTQRRKARSRDSNTCQSCGMSSREAGQNMDVHHIVSYHEFDDPKDANALDNLICLCRSCHRQVENGTLECLTP